MIIKKLKPEEYRQTRPLWTRVFEEDTEEFLNYYYSVKTDDNEMYVIITEGEIHAMLHLNPYVMHIGEKEEGSRYIVAVATDILYRGKGFMTELLRKSIRDMYTQKIPFTFLMPASEAIYYPHNFRYIYAAEQWTVQEEADQKTTAYDLLSRAKKQSKEQGEISLHLARPADCRRIAQFAEKVLQPVYQVYAKRNWRYYELLLKELAGENGGMLIAEKDGEIKGTVLFDEENGFSVREPLFAPGCEDIFSKIGLNLIKKEKKKPIIMARILHLESLLTCMTCKEEMELEFQLVDPIIRENNKVFVLRGNEERIVVRTRPAAKTGSQIQKISVEALTSLLFGYKTPEAVEKEEQEILSDTFKQELQKLVLLSPVFLNEIV